MSAGVVLHCSRRSGGRNGNDITLAEPPFRPLSHEKCFQAKIALIK
jgi:hypothetical protein